MMEDSRPALIKFIAILSMALFVTLLFIFRESDVEHTYKLELRAQKLSTALTSINKKYDSDLKVSDELKDVVIILGLREIELPAIKKQIAWVTRGKWENKLLTIDTESRQAELDAIESSLSLRLEETVQEQTLLDNLALEGKGVGHLVLEMIEWSENEVLARENKNNRRQPRPEIGVTPRDAFCAALLGEINVGSVMFELGDKSRSLQVDTDKLSEKSRLALRDLIDFQDVVEPIIDEIMSDQVRSSVTSILGITEGLELEKVSSFQIICEFEKYGEGITISIKPFANRFLQASSSGSSFESREIVEQLYGTGENVPVRNIDHQFYKRLRYASVASLADDVTLELADAVTNDPLSYIHSGFLLGIGEQENLNIIAVVPDRVLIPFSGSTGEEVTRADIAMFNIDFCTFRKSEKTLSLRPGFTTQYSRPHLDRTVLRALASDMLDYGHLREQTLLNTAHLTRDHRTLQPIVSYLRTVTGHTVANLSSNRTRELRNSVDTDTWNKWHEAGAVKISEIPQENLDMIEDRIRQFKPTFAGDWENVTIKFEVRELDALALSFERPGMPGIYIIDQTSESHMARSQNYNNYRAAKVKCTDLNFIHKGTPLITLFDSYESYDMRDRSVKEIRLDPEQKRLLEFVRAKPYVPYSSRQRFSGY